MNKYWLDIDGVLADFCGHVVKTFNLPDHPFTEWNDSRIRDNWKAFENDVNFWLSMPRIEQPISFKISGYITARPVPSCVSAYWLAKNGFPYAPVVTVAPMGSKTDHLKYHSEVVLIDDAAHNFNECVSNGVACMLYNTPYNQHVDTPYRIYSLGEIKS